MTATTSFCGVDGRGRHDGVQVIDERVGREHFLADNHVLARIEMEGIYAIGTRPDIAEYLKNLAGPGIFQSDGLWEPS
jgi:hypothetical protein